MGKQAQRRRGEDKQPKVDHFILGTNAYIDLRRYLGSRPHDETRQLIALLEAMPAITVADIAKRDADADRLAAFEAAKKDNRLLGELPEDEALAAAGADHVDISDEEGA